MYVKTTLTAGVPVTFSEQADFFRLLESERADVEVYFYRNGAEIGRVQNIGAGYAERFPSGYDRLTIASASGGQVAYVARLGGDVKYDTPPNGNVTVTNTSGSIADTEKTVTSASAELVAAKAGRRYLLIQNKDAAGIVYISFGKAAVVGAGVKIAPGGSYVADANYCPSNQIFAIGSIASNANVCVVEG